jgi:hypothetical protein
MRGEFSVGGLSLFMGKSLDFWLACDRGYISVWKPHHCL